jgi:hypothetical protein
VKTRSVEEQPASVNNLKMTQGTLFTQVEDFQVLKDFRNSDNVRVGRPAIPLGKYETSLEFSMTPAMSKCIQLGQVTNSWNNIGKYKVSHNTWDYKNALGRPINDNVESWQVSHFEAKDHTF